MLGEPERLSRGRHADASSRRDGLGTPQYLNSLSGFGGQPALRFDRFQDDALQPPNLDPVNDASAGFTSHQFTISFRTGSNVTDTQMLYEEGGQVNGMNLYVDGGELIGYAWSQDDGWTPIDVRTPIAPNQTYVATLVFDGSGAEPATPTDGQLELYLNDAVAPVATASDPSVGVLADHPGSIAIGNVINDTELAGSSDQNDSGGFGFDGWIGEVVHYETSTTEVRRRLIANAVAAKVGLTAASPLYAYASNGRRVAGIGQSADGSTHLVSRSDQLSFDGASAPAAGDFLLVGHDGGAYSTVPEMDVAGIGTRLDRVWRLDRSGSPSSGLVFDVSSLQLGGAQAFRLLVEDASGSGTFASGASVVTGTYDGTAGTFTIAAADVGALSDGDYFTLAKTEESGPQDVTYSPASLAERQANLPASSGVPTIDADARVSDVEILGVTVNDVNGNSQPTPTFGDAGSGSDLEIDPSTGEITATASAPIGLYSVDVQVTDEQGKTASFTGVFDVTVQEEVRVAYSDNYQTINPGETISTVSPEVLTEDGSASYALIDGNIGSLSGAEFPNITFDAATGEISGTTSNTGLARAVVVATGGGGTAVGDDTTDVQVAIVAADGPAGVGDVNTLVQDLDAKDLSLSDGDPVALWPDGSAAGQVVDQTNGSQQPVYRSTGLNGRPAVEFDGTDDILIYDDSDRLNSGGEPYTARTFSIAFQSPSNLSPRQALYEEGGGIRGINAYVVGGDLYVGMWNIESGDDVDTTPWGPYFFSAGTSENGEGTVSIAPDTPYVLTFTYDAAAGRIEAYLNGQLIGQNSSSQPVGRFYDHNNPKLGGQGNSSIYHDIGEDTATEDYFFQGFVGRFVQYGVALSESQRQLVESVLGDTYGAAVAPSRFTSPIDLVDHAGVGNSGTGDAHDLRVASTRAGLENPALSGPPVFAVFGHDEGEASFRRDDSAPTDYRGDGSTTTDDRVGSRLERTWYLDRTGAPGFDLTVDVTGLDPRTGQFVLLVDTDPTFTTSATVVEGSVSGSTITFAGAESAFSSDAYFTLGRTVSSVSSVTNLTYSPNPLEAENGSGSLVTASPSFDGGDPIPTFTIVDVQQGGSSIATPAEFSIDENTGEVTVDPSTSLQGSFDVTIEADNNEGTPAQAVLNVQIFESITTLTYLDPSQTVTSGESVTLTVDEPASLSIPDADYTYAVERVNVFGTIQSDLSGSGLTLQADGTISGTLPADGTVGIEIRVTADGGASGTATTTVAVSSVGSTGPGGVGDATTTVLRLDPESLIDLADGASITTWSDQSTYGNDALVNSGSSPTYAKTTGAVNDRPVISFSGGGQFFDIQDSDVLNTQDVALQRTYTIVFRTNAPSTRQVIYEEGGTTRGVSFGIENSNFVASAWNLADDSQIGGGADPTTPWEDAATGDDILVVERIVTAGTVYVATLSFDFAEQTVDVWLNATQEGTVDGAGRLYSHGGNMGLGGTSSNHYLNQTAYNNTTNPLNGDLGDVVASSVDLNETQQRIQHNALAAKYGATVASADDLYAGEATSHDIDVVGIGRTSATDRHARGIAGGLTLVQDAGFDDGDFVIAGHDKRQNAEATDDVASSSGTLTARMLRTWYLSRTEPSSSDAAFDVTFDLSDSGLDPQAGNASGYRLIYRPAGQPSGSNWTVLGVTAAVSGDAITFAGVSFPDDHVFTLATVDRAASPIAGLKIAIQGTPGFDATGFTGPDRGWRFIGSLVDNATASSLEFADGSQFIDFNPPRGPIFYTWDETLDDPTQAGTQEGWWTAASPSTALEPGRGALLFLYDNTDYPIDPELQIHFDDALEPFATDADVDVTSLNRGSTFHFLANSYAVPYDLNGLDTGVDADSDGIADFKAVVQVFDATATAGSNEPTDNAVGFYTTRTSDAAAAPSSRQVAPGQGFFVERNDFVNDNGQTADQLTFDAAFTRDRLFQPPGFIGSEEVRSGPRPVGRKIDLQLAVRDAGGTALGLDRAASVYFREGARTGEDQFDASKFYPLTSSYAVLGISGPDRDGEERLWAQRSWPLPDGPVEVPLDVQVEGVSGTLEISAVNWYQIPDEWRVYLIDTKGTATTADDVEHELKRDGAAPYRFDAASAKVAPSRPETAQSDGSEGDRVRGIPSLRRLRPQWVSASGSSALGSSAPGGSSDRASDRARRVHGPVAIGDGTDGPGQRQEGGAASASVKRSASGASAKSTDATPRFVLRVQPSEDPLPVTLARLDARPDGQDVVVEWETLSEVNNDGFEVQTQRLARGDTSAADGAWSSVEFVDGSGTTQEPRSYSLRISGLDYGRYAVRLQQVDTDGTTSYSAPENFELRLDRPYAVGAPYPNPVRTRATLDVTVREEQEVRVEMYDLLGRRIAVLHDAPIRPNQTLKLPVETRSLSSGLYFLRVLGDDFAETRRMTIVR